MSNRKPPQLPKEEPAIPLEPSEAKIRTTFLRQKIDKVKELQREGKTKEEIELQVSDFVEKYPTLFKMITSSEGYNEATLRTMLAMMERMGNGELTQDQASGIVGQRLFDTHIKPKIDKEEQEKK
jgi:hypothetical protein